MIIFIDTNVLVGYCFKVHKDNSCCEILDSKSNLWLSDKVLAEWKRIEKEIHNEYENKILRHIQDIRNNISDMVEINDRKRLINMTDREVRTFFQKWYEKEVDYPILKDDLCDQIEVFLLDMKSDKINRLSKLLSLCSQHNRTTNYPTEKSNLKPCVHNGDGDRGIILDAHDLYIRLDLRKMGDELHFWTFDGGISNDCKDVILRDTNISCVKDVKYDQFSL